MKGLFHRGLVLLAPVCCAVLSCPGLVAPAHSASSSQTASASGPAKRWAQFELNQAEPMGDPQTGKPVTLTIYLGGVTAGATPVVAICESVAFQAQTVMLEPDEESMVLKGRVTLEPILLAGAPRLACQLGKAFVQSSPVGQPSQLIVEGEMRGTRLARDQAAGHVDPHAGRYSPGGALAMPEDCIACHSAVSFRPSVVTTEFHSRFSLPLDGAHRAVSCVDCHSELRAKPATSTLTLANRTLNQFPASTATRTCATCHQNPHGVQFQDRFGGSAGDPQNTSVAAHACIMRALASFEGSLD